MNADGSEGGVAGKPNGGGNGAEGRLRPAYTPLRFAARELLRDLSPEQEAKLFDRGRATDPEVVRTVAEIIADVRERGDAALWDAALRFDRVTLDALEVPKSEWSAAADRLEPHTRAALEDAADAIARFHRAQLPSPFEMELRPGVRLGRRADALERVGVYAPGGRAAYPSSVLMGVVPARAAGVGEVVVCSPAGPNGRPPDAVLAACHVAGADRLFAIGGASAIAALAYGTKSVPRVDKVVGPGNAYVTEAKRQLTGTIAIDCPAGPSEILIIADESADKALIAVEMMAQAEHDPDAAAVLVTTDMRHLPTVPTALERNVGDMNRREIIEQSFAARGAILYADTLDEAIAFSNRYAPEHLLLMVKDPRAVLPRVRSAGTVFLGAHSSVAFGDYMTGANHVLPTAGLARAYSGLSTHDFLRWTTYQEVTAEGAAELAVPTTLLAGAEGLQAHALAATLRARQESTRYDIEERAASRAADAPPAVRFRRAYADIQPYDPGRLPTAVDLSDNTNLFGVAPSVERLLSSLPPSAITRYPSVYAQRLKEALAGLHGVSPENVVTGCGSDDVIDSAFRAFLEPGERVAYPWPTFGVIPQFVRMNAAAPVAVPLADGFALDADALAATRAAVTYLCRPNNPTGTCFDRDAVERVIARAAGVVVIDEAYVDFAEDDVLDLALSSGRALSLRTMSKAYGLAGLRVGYAIGPAALVAEVEKSRGPYKLSGPAEAAALEVLARDMNWVRDGVAAVKQNRARLGAELARRGLRFWPSAGNFVLVAVPGAGGPANLESGTWSRSESVAAPGAGGPANLESGTWSRSESVPDGQYGATSFGRALRSRGVAVRAFPGLPQAGDCIRVSIGPWQMMAAFLDALDGALTQRSVEGGD